MLYSCILTGQKDDYTNFQVQELFNFLYGIWQAYITLLSHCEEMNSLTQC